MGFQFDLKKSLQGFDPKAAESTAKNNIKQALQALTDNVYRGGVAGLAGSPMDMTNMLGNALRTGSNAALGTDFKQVENPIGGSEWIGQQLQNSGIVSPTRRPIGELLAGVASPDPMDLMHLAPAMIAFHGSPHKFDKFDLSKIGTGEGAQAYGHGIYFADAEDTGRDYARKLSGDNTWQFHDSEGNLFDAFDKLKNLNVRATLQRSGGDINAAINKAKTVLSEAPETTAAEYAQKDIDALSAVTGGLYRPEASLYKVDIPDEHIANMLEWDKPISQQPQSVLNRLDEIKANTFNGQYLTDEDKGQNLLAGLAQKLGGQPEASNYLRSLGIPGVRYLDQASRGAATGSAATKNTVLFDDRLVKILERNGKKL
jgi:hypothetical protein